MAEKKIITKKVISKRVATPVEKEVVVEQEKQSLRSDDLRTVEKKRECFFCKSKTEPTYTDIITLRKFVSDRAKIVPKMRSSACSKHQRRITKQVKYARHLSLLPFTPKV